MWIAASLDEPGPSHPYIRSTAGPSGGLERLPVVRNGFHRVRSVHDKIEVDDPLAVTVRGECPYFKYLSLVLLRVNPNGLRRTRPLVPLNSPWIPTTGEHDVPGFELAWRIERRRLMPSPEGRGEDRYSPPEPRPVSQPRDRTRCTHPPVDLRRSVLPSEQQARDLDHLRC